MSNTPLNNKRIRSLSSAQGPFTKIDHNLAREASPNKIERIQVIYTDHMELNKKSVTESFLENPHVWKLNHTLLNTSKASVLRNQEKHSKLNLKQTGKKNRNNKDQRGNQYRKINEIKSWFFGKINKCSLADFVSPESTPLFRARGRVERREKEKRSYSCAEFLPRRHVGHGAFHLVPCS